MTKKKSDIIKRLSNLLDEGSSFSRKGLSAFSGISAQTISSWLNRGSLPSADLFPVIADYLGVSVRWLITGEDEQGLTLEERNLLVKYQRLTDDNQRNIRVLIDSMLSVPAEGEKEALA
jgi:transcriptional regulator with XRE-family HTH domain